VDFLLLRRISTHSTFELHVSIANFILANSSTDNIIAIFADTAYPYDSNCGRIRLWSRHHRTRDSSSLKKSSSSTGRCVRPKRFEYKVGPRCCSNYSSFITSLAMHPFVSKRSFYCLLYHTLKRRKNVVIHAHTRVCRVSMQS
jgi:hypothetical protein